MKYYIISKIEFIDEAVKHTPIGYTNSAEDAENITETSTKLFTDWIADNIDGLSDCTTCPSAFFNTTPVCYEIGWISNNVDGGEFEITEVDTLTLD